MLRCWWTELWEQSRAGCSNATIHQLLPSLKLVSSGDNIQTMPLSSSLLQTQSAEPLSHTVYMILLCTYRFAHFAFPLLCHTNRNLSCSAFSLLSLPFYFIRIFDIPKILQWNCSILMKISNNCNCFLHLKANITLPNWTKQASILPLCCHLW